MADWLEITGLDDIRRKLNAMGPAVHRAMRIEVRRAALDVQSRARQAVTVDTGRLRNSIAVEITDGGLDARIGTNVEYAEGIEHGLPPGTRPDVASLRGWVRRKLGIRDPKEARRVAFLIARKIQRHGTDAQPYLHPAIEAARPEFRRRLSVAVDRAIREAARGFNRGYLDDTSAGARGTVDRAARGDD